MPDGPSDETRNGAEAFQKANEARDGKLLWLLEEMCLTGRTGFAVRLREPGGRLERVTLEQIVIVDPENPMLQQRLLDALQELVVLRVRAMRVLKMGASPDTSSTSADAVPAPPEEMYG